jgi:hypothetical protein
LLLFTHTDPTHDSYCTDFYLLYTRSIANFALSICTICFLHGSALSGLNLITASKLDQNCSNDEIL